MSMQQRATIVGLRRISVWIASVRRLLTLCSVSIKPLFWMGHAFLCTLQHGLLRRTSV
jgi:hypothetical protein